MLSNVQIANVPRVGRKMRRPQHSSNIRQYPFQIQPFMIAPVLPGDTLKNLLFQARVVTAPIKNPLIGWWAEFYYFYVPLRSLSGSSDFQAMMLNPTATAGNAAGSTTPAIYTYNGGVNFVQQCLTTVIEEFFRDEGESLPPRRLTRWSSLSSRTRAGSTPP